ncbi:translation initiation factor eIF-2 beta chain-like protein [Arabidopsis thaliana]|uniref:Eukaryotic translation initiation factor 2 subunit beta n=1 Tax=Arabidopsis thaliana TaxID=3702 RepID=Q9LZV2_ARATH|nr:eukaryotic translation initiation factor 2B family protein / eIF-2B family protein [Arabidopsis thaliana]AED90412.1 eukaryotic translation initiation factor 2B family protein / eIF-2B family protein [Arabidopsis thaliana]CAB82764.1 translation initiation factor eIF-2 beta chain-like protein [Arabidopsis thaliana]|eukprot:NP_195814.1 eukaryotic translation initiation factor 2B family protein / eIF-2B family protein [Arabidopsis thaliana]
MDLQQKQACWKLELEVIDNDSSWVSKFDPSKKKKKKKQKPLIREDDIFFQNGGHFTEDNLPDCQSSRKFEPDYGYKELLSMVFDRLREEDVEVSTERPRTVMMPPQLLAEGTITVCLNFADLCRTMHRKPDHVMKFLLAQMETKVSLNKQQRLEIKGLVSSKDFQAVFRKYIDAFVICVCCKSPDTALAEEGNGLFNLRCETGKDEDKLVSFESVLVQCGLVAPVDIPNLL